MIKKEGSGQNQPVPSELKFAVIGRIDLKLEFKEVSVAFRACFPRGPLASQI